MSEGDVVEQLAHHTDTLMTGVSLIFSIVSAYIVALNYFIGSSNFAARLGSFLFLTLVLGMLAMLMMGVQSAHAGLIAQLAHLDAEGQLSLAGKAVLANAMPNLTGAVTGNHYSIDGVLNACASAGLGFVYVALAYMTFLHKWSPEAIPVTIQ